MRSIAFALIPVLLMPTATCTTAHLRDALPSTVLVSLQTAMDTTVATTIAFQASASTSSGPILETTVILSSAFIVSTTTAPPTSSSALKKITIPIATATAAATSMGVGLGKFIGVAAGVFAVL